MFSEHSFIMRNVQIWYFKKTEECVSLFGSQRSPHQNKWLHIAPCWPRVDSQALQALDDLHLFVPPEKHLNMWYSRIWLHFKTQMWILTEAQSWEALNVFWFLFDNRKQLSSSWQLSMGSGLAGAKSTLRQTSQTANVTKPVVTQ